MRTDDLDFELPDPLIATTPAEPRDSARLMVVHRDTQRIEHHQVKDLPGLGILSKGDLIVVNQSRVLPAYLTGTREATGGQVTGLYLDSVGQGRWQVMLESRGSLKPGETIRLGKAQDTAEPVRIELIESLGFGAWSAKLLSERDTLGVLEQIGNTPLPPYIRKQRRRLGQDEINDNDPLRYNTVYADKPGSIAAPTAGLHFTPGLLDAIDGMGVKRVAVDLHVGVGTFAPVRSESLEDHPMHAESFSVARASLDAIRDTRANGGRLLVIGTTTVRALESLPDDALEPGAYPEGVTASTNLFVHPGSGHTFRFTDRLMTNFHLPKSTLLALVAALPGVGLDRLMDAYRLAVAEKYRFYSYGDAMIVV